ncbi:MAG: helix-turn-helix domain-containing protein [Pseudomonadota bacterium]
MQRLMEDDWESANVWETEGDAPDSEAPPFRPFARIAVRGIGEYSTHFCAAVAERFDGDVDIGMVFVNLLRRADLDGSGVGAMAPISISALSRSTNRPFETVRRLCNRLCAMGLVERCDDGPFIPTPVLTQPIVMELREIAHDNLVRMICDLAKVGYPLPLARDAKIGRATIEHAAMDILLHGFEVGQPPDPRPNWQRPFIYISLMAANARKYTFDPELAQRYADVLSPPPEELRTPVGATVLARAIGLPYSTVRNNLATMVEEGMLSRSGRGYLIDMAWMQRPDMAAMGVAVAAQLDRALRSLALAGFPMHGPETAYWRGPPKLIAFD